ncbi:predicted protein [Plenodomus lingam JN3]|uniref:Predicted protein n=1 Tax=Leptosphaeria maculans (strain JN3 / isolate v23.1.3 / race Av1-4-5-6-7-8) TaxID=985895 RepID=E4ZYZ7_LEPMJ|nr:predicted protein [Plenodomus lingam JN3]CBX96432.1 predicted protein [Plenodomus lingam JN3]
MRLPSRLEPTSCHSRSFVESEAPQKKEEGLSSPSAPPVTFHSCSLTSQLVPTGIPANQDREKEEGGGAGTSPALGPLMV